MLDTAAYALFSRGEMERRYARARKLMAEQGLDALVVTGEENFQYLAGTAASIALHHSLTRPSVLVLPLEQDPVIITQSKIYVLMSTYVDDIVEYFDVLSFPHQVIVDVLKARGPAAESRRGGAGPGAADGDPGRGVPRAGGGAPGDVIRGCGRAHHPGPDGEVDGGAGVHPPGRRGHRPGAAAAVRPRDRAGHDGAGRRPRDAAPDPRGGRRPHVLRPPAAGSAGLQEPVSLRTAPPEGGDARDRCGGVRPHVHDRLSPDGHAGQGHRRSEAGPRRRPPRSAARWPPPCGRGSSARTSTGW